jgi:hypothetical protein
VAHRSISLWSLAALTSMAMLACSSESSPPTLGRATPAAGRDSAPEAPGSVPRIVALGDSLTAGYGIGKDEAYPALLQRRLDAAGYRYEIVNAGVSGDTSAGGLNRLDWSLDGNVRVLVTSLAGTKCTSLLKTANTQKQRITLYSTAIYGFSKKIGIKNAKFSP